MDSEPKNNGTEPGGMVSSQAGAAVPEPQSSSVVRALRQQLGMTQEELAHALGLTVGTISRWEKGRFRPSRLARGLILEFARAHNVPVALKPVRPV